MGVSPALLISAWGIVRPLREQTSFTIRRRLDGHPNRRIGSFINSVKTLVMLDTIAANRHMNAYGGINAII